ncbi:MAG: TSUP family transporter [Acidobacteriia bacterium]|nr:TSUP family transporter [Terriglobia bacterium]
MQIVAGILVGIAVGIFSGLVGIGGGVVLVPILVYGFAMSQQQAQGTTLALLLPPTGLLAFWQYYKAGHADLKLGLLLALGIFIGGYFGGAWAQHIPTGVLRKIFAVVIAATAAKMFFEK